jgi:tetratricopeptide (TPR) repeat protein
VELVRCFENRIADPSRKPDLKLFDWAIRTSRSSGAPTSQFYLVGKFLARRGYEAEAVRYLQQAATTPCPHRYDRCLAAHALRERGIEVGKRRPTEFDEETAHSLELLDRAFRLTEVGATERALAAFSALIAERPDFVDAYQWRGNLYDRLDRFDEAVSDLTRAHELLPGCARFLNERGQVHEHWGRHQQAIDDYEAALSIDPHYSVAHHNLAFLRAACVDEAFRDPARAIEHARIAAEPGDSAGHLALTARAVAAAAAGEFDQAIAFESQALNSAPEASKAMHRERLELFQRREPYRRQPGWWRK